MTRSNLEEWVMTTCRDKIRPAIIPFFEIVRNIEPGKDVAVVRVTRGYDVHSLWHNNSYRYYIRVGTKIMTEEGVTVGGMLLFALARRPTAFFPRLASMPLPFPELKKTMPRGNGARCEAR